MVILLLKDFIEMSLLRTMPDAVDIIQVMGENDYSLILKIKCNLMAVY